MQENVRALIQEVEREISGNQTATTDTPTSIGDEDTQLPENVQQEKTPLQLEALRAQVCFINGLRGHPWAAFLLRFSMVAVQQ